jgi:hypothetical protein
MKEDLQQANTSRRGLLRHGLGLGMGVLFIAVAGSARGEAKKISQGAVRYVVNDKTPGETCSRCRYYTPALSSQESGSCLMVEGPISPRGHCREFAPADVN